MIYEELKKNQKLRRTLNILILLLSVFLLSITVYYIQNPIIKRNFLDQIIDYANTHHLKLGLENIGESTLLNANELYEQGIITKKEYEKYEDVIVKITLIDAKKVKVEIFGSNKDTTQPILILNGPTDITLEYGEQYKEMGYQAIDETDGDITSKVKISGVINEIKIGSYQLIYTVTDKEGNQTRKVRNIKIVDTKAPTIKLNGKDTIYLYINQEYNEEGATANDNYDGNISTQIITSGKVNSSQFGSYQITYTAKDTSGNTTTIIRNIIVIDYNSPKIFLNGNTTMNVYLNEDYIEPGVQKVEDQYDSNLKDKVRITGTVKTDTLGTYQIIYTVTNSRGKSTTITRTINVQKAPDKLTDFELDGNNDDIVIPGLYENNVHRTFDITNILNQYNESMGITNVAWHTTGSGVSIIEGTLIVTKNAVPGTITITAIVNDIARSIEVTLVKTPKLNNFSIDGPNKINIEGHIENQITFILANGKDQYGDDYAITEEETKWTIVDNPSNIKIEDGILIFNSTREPGEVTIRAENNGVIKTKTIILEKIEIDEIEIYEDNILISNTVKSMMVGETITVNYKITPTNATFQTGTWICSNPDKITVDNGEIEVIDGVVGDTITISLIIDDKTTSFTIEIID